MNTDTVKRMLSQYREMKATSMMQNAIDHDHQSGIEIPPLWRKIALIESWLIILTDEERYVVTKHLIDRLPWPLVVVEYAQRWGQADAKDERTLKRFQAAALSKISQFIRRSGYEASVASLFSAENPLMLGAWLPQT